MIDWLKRDRGGPPMVHVGEAQLPLVIRRLPQARRLTLRLAPDGSEVRISMPRWGRTADALAFAASRSAWLAAQLASLTEGRRAAAPPGPGSVVPFRGENLIVRHELRALRRPETGEGHVLIGGPADSIARRLHRWLEAEARTLMADDLVHYCAIAALPVPALALSRAQRRWGSCSARGVVRINWRLIMAPDFVRRSVVAHEVAHLVHFDHSPRFHAALDDLFEGEIAQANLWLKREGRGLYAPFG